MSSQKSRQLSTPVLAAIAVLLGAVTGAWWIYGTTAGSGNGSAVEMESSTASDGDQKCAMDTAIAETLAPLATGEVAAMAIQNPPRSLPELSFKDDGGEPVSLGHLSGRAHLINFWATWCAPCRAEMPALSRLQTEMGGEAFAVTTINIDTGSLDKPKAFMTEIGVNNLPLYHDATMGVFNTLKKEGLAFGLPATLLVDAKGCLLGVMNGPAEWDSPDGKALIGKLIEEKTS